MLPLADFIYVDAGHTYEDVRRDSGLALQVLAPKGIVAWHDYGNSATPGVTKFLDELAGQRPVVHVQESWICFMQAGGANGNH